MNEKTSDNAELTDYFAETVHGFVDRFKERAAGMEKVAGEGSSAMISERAATKIERKMQKIERKMDEFQDYAEKNPMMASLMAFGVEALSSRALKKRGKAVAEDASSEEADVSEAA